MRRLFRILIAISGIAFAITLTASIAAIAGLGGGAPVVQARQAGEALFHILAVVPSSDSERYYSRAVEAMERAARKDGAVLQILTYAQGDAPSAIARILRLAAELEPDGIIVSAPFDPLILEAVDAMAQQGVPIVTLENDLPGSLRAVFVGTNPYSVGALAAAAVAEAFPRGAKVALVLSRDYADGGARGATIVAGFLQGARDKRGIVLSMTRTTLSGPSGSEEIVRELLADRTDIDVSVFIGARDAEGAARALIEYDKVGALSIIGFDDDPALLELVDLGVVYASIARSPERSGEEAIAATMTMARGGRASAYIDPGLRIIRRGSGLK